MVAVFKESICTSSIRTWGLAARELHFSRRHLCTCCVFYRDNCNPRQRGRKLITPAKHDGRVCAVIFLAPCALGIRPRYGADSSGKPRAIFGAKCGNRRVSLNQALSMASKSSAAIVKPLLHHYSVAQSSAYGINSLSCLVLMTYLLDF